MRDSGLDAGCGVGLQCLQLAEAVGPAGHITGLDISAEMLAYGREMVKAAGLSDRISFREGDVASLPFDDNTFDWVWSVDCVGYAPWDTIKMLKEITKDYENIEIDHFDGLLVKYAEQVGAVTIIRGLRALSDFEYEFELALMNRHLNENVDTIFMMTSEHYSFIRSSLVKEVARLGGNISDKVPPVVEKYLLKHFNS